VLELREVSLQAKPGELLAVSTEGHGCRAGRPSEQRRRSGD